MSASATRPRDVHSYARPDEARVTHVALEAEIDFAERKLRGRATLDLDRAPGAEAVVLDTRDLHIGRVTDGAGSPLRYTLGAGDPVLGSPLTVELPSGTTRISVEYQTDPSGQGLFWLKPEQTVGGRQPFVFSQGQAILTRSWLPTQDSLGLRQTYEARITVPDGITAVMSAEHLTPEGVPQQGGRCFHFRMRHPIPTYLIALAAGDLEFRPVGGRTGVFAERALADAARDEFEELERMLQAAEAIAGVYRWERADLLVAPPAFPFGGMENPRLTFVSSTLLAGDRSLTTIVAHELAHAWSGNLVTPATWNDFWLNEGFTVYLELRINEALFGPDRASALEVYGYQALAAEIERLGPDSPDTRLYLDLAGRDPTVAVTPVPYVKGAAFLKRIEQVVGRDRFDDFLRSWFDRHAFASVTTEMFASELRRELLAGEEGWEAEIGIDEWLYAPGLPANAPRPRSALLARVQEAADAFVGGAAAESLPLRAWSPQEWRHFLNVLPRRLSEERLRELDRAAGLSSSRNSEVAFAWLRLAVVNQYEPAVPALERFLTGQGRRKFVRPLYEALMQTAWGSLHAGRIYRAARTRYHATVVAELDALVQ